MDTSHIDDLLEHLLHMKDKVALEKALAELLTPTELAEISKRLQILRLLEAGMSQREIARKLNVGIATVTRGSRALKSE